MLTAMYLTKLYERIEGQAIYLLYKNSENFPHTWIFINSLYFKGRISNCIFSSLICEMTEHPVKYTCRMYNIYLFKKNIKKDCIKAYQIKYLVKRTIEIHIYILSTQDWISSSNNRTQTTPLLVTRQFKNQSTPHHSNPIQFKILLIRLLLCGFWYACVYAILLSQLSSMPEKSNVTLAYKWSLTLPGRIHTIWHHWLSWWL